MDVSVIIPYDKVDARLRTAVAGALGQDDISLELIVAGNAASDAGSSWPEWRDERVRRLITPENAGLSFARNFGIEAAKGGYVFFHDVGDELLPGGIASLRAAAVANEVDVAVGGYRLDVTKELEEIGLGGGDCFPGNYIELPGLDGVYGRETYPELLDDLLTGDIFHPLGNKLYRRSFAACVSFDENMSSVFADELYNVEVFARSERTAGVKTVVTLVNKSGPSSPTPHFDDDRYFDTMKLRAGYERMLAALSCADESRLRTNCCRQLMLHVMGLLINLRRAATFADPGEILCQARRIIDTPCFWDAAERADVSGEFMISLLDFHIETMAGQRRMSFPVGERNDYIQCMAEAFLSLARRWHQRYSEIVDAIERMRSGDPSLPPFPARLIRESI